MSVPSRDEVRASIRNAFQSETPPDLDGLTMHRPCPECEEVATILGGRHWTDVTPALVSKVKDALPLLSRAAFRHYLPAFMTCAVDDRAAVDTMWDSLVLELKPRRGTDFEARVQGSRVRPYRVRLGVETLDERDWARAERVMAGRAAFSGAWWCGPKIPNCRKTHGRAPCAARLSAQDESNWSPITWARATIENLTPS